jgi:hypothetical protein
MGGQPDAAKYEALVEQLSEIERRNAAKEINELKASFDALCAVISFLNGDARVLDREATRPLSRLMRAVHDWTQGAKPRLLFDPRNRKVAKGAPIGTTAIILRAQVNLAFGILLKGGMPKEEAAHWLEAELKRSGIEHPNGKAIIAKEITRWSAERGGKSLKESDKVFATIVSDSARGVRERAGSAGLSSQPLDRPRLQRVARGLILRLKIAGF